MDHDQDQFKVVNPSSRSLIVSFGGFALQFGRIPPFEFLHFLNTHFHETDKLFYVDRHQIHYHRGIYGISSNIEETISHLRNEIAGYERVFFMGVSAGGYAAILFGSLLNVDHVIAFIPQTILYHSKYDSKYKDLLPYISGTTQYHLYGDLSIQNPKDAHHISHCIRMLHPNVHIYKRAQLILPEMRNSGELFHILSKIIS